MAENRILIIRGGAIGDFILTLPVLQALREMFPTAHLEVLGYPRIAALARWGGLADGIRSLEDRPMARFFARRAPLDPSWEDYFGRCGVILSYLFDPDGIFQENIARCSRAQFIQGPHRPADDSGTHASEVLLQPLQRLAVFGADPVPRLTPPARRQGQHPEDLSSLLPWITTGPTLALHPGSGSDTKNWPEPRWRELLQSIASSGENRILLIGGEAEGDRLERLASGVDASRVRVLRSAPLPEVAECLSACTAFLGHDSGISHLAAALGLPVTVLWGPTVERVWRPQGERVRILRHEGGLARIEVPTVLQALRPDGG
ncbi:MAG TPA: hypothetical protein DCM86_09940 [Verrucomicrobiales bacterium]|nr:hypothetical protein [Verrucomicrobiales bacterium]